MIVRARNYERFVYSIGDCDLAPNAIFLAYKKLNKKTFIQSDGYTLFEDHAMATESYVSITTLDDIYFLRRGYFFGEAEKKAREKIQKTSR